LEKQLDLLVDIWINGIGGHYAKPMHPDMFSMRRYQYDISKQKKKKLTKHTAEKSLSGSRIAKRNKNHRVKRNLFKVEINIKH